LCPDTPVLADSKTVDGGQLEAEMVLGAGAAFMTVLSSAASASHEAVGRVAAKFGARVIVDTITQAGQKELLPASAAFPESFAYVGVHRPSDAHAAGDSSTAHIEAVAEMHRRGFRVALAGGLGPDSIDSVLAFEPEIVIVGSANTESANPQGVARGLWLDIKATIYDRPILVPAEAEVCVAGCAIIAAVAVGAVADWAEARSRFVSFADAILPNPAWRDRYLRYAELFDARYESNRALRDRLDALDAEQ